MLTGERSRKSYLTSIRGVDLLPEEEVTHTFSPQEGMVDEPWRKGQLLITTSQRIISFSEDGGSRATFLVPVEEVKGVIVKASTVSNTRSLMQWIVLIAAGLIVYLALSYWITGKFSDPVVPGVNMGLGPILVLLAIILAGGLIVKHYFTPGDGQVTFQGSSWSFSFPFTATKSSEDIYRLVNTTFVTRRSQNGYAPPKENGGPPLQ
jgi:hypothetical protein